VQITVNTELFKACSTISDLENVCRGNKEQLTTAQVTSGKCLLHT